MISQPRSKRLLSTVGLFIGLTIGGARLSAESLPDWMQPGVRAGSSRLDKKLFLSLDDMGSVTDIQRGELRSPGKIEVGVAGNYGARFFDDQGKLNASVAFAVREPEGFRVAVDIVRQTHSSGLLFFRHAWPAATYDSLVGPTGREIWRTPYVPFASTFGDLNGDGTPAFISTRSQDAAIEVRNASGAIIWQTPRGYTEFKLAVVSSERDKTSMLLADESGALIGFGAHGERLFERKPAIDFFFSDFSTLRWPTVCEGQCLLVSGKDKIDLLSADGEKVVRELGPADYAMDARGISVRLSGTEPPLLAVAGSLPYKGGQWAGFKAVHGALYVFDSHGSPIYHEVLPEPVEALGVVPRSDGKTQTLLVGGVNKVWQYSVPEQNTSHSRQSSN